MALIDSVFPVVRSTLAGIGGNLSTIAIDGGAPVPVITNEESRGRDFEMGGQQEEVSREAVCRHAEFSAAYPNPSRDYLGKLAVLDGETYRVSQIRLQSAGFVTVELAGEFEAP